MQEFLLALPVLLFSMVAHEYAHGYAALRQGDPTARDLGRLTLNPLKHIDPWYTLLLPLMLYVGSGGRVLFGGAKPVPVNPRNYRAYRRGDLIVSSAGIVVNLGLFAICTALAAIVGIAAAAAGAADAAAWGFVQRALMWGVWLNVLLAFFNLIPIPPLDGSHLLYHLLPPRAGALYRRTAQFGFLILIALVFLVPQALYVLLTPAFALQGLACDLTAAHHLQPFLLCRL